jgi:hypothetical protein
VDPLEAFPDVKRRAPWYGLHVAVAMLFVGHHAPGEVETKAGALADRLGGEEGLEEPRPDLIRNAGSGVGSH